MFKVYSPREWRNKERWEKDPSHVKAVCSNRELFLNTGNIGSYTG